MPLNDNIKIKHREGGALEEISCLDVNGYEITLAAYFQKNASVRITCLARGTDENTCQIAQALVNESSKSQLIPPGHLPDTVLAASPEDIIEAFGNQGLPPPKIL